MQKITKYNFNTNQVTDVAFVNIFPGYIWISFINADGESILRKVSMHNLSQIYFETAIECNQIIHLDVSNNNDLIVGLQDTTRFGLKYLTSDTSQTPVTYTKPVGITENMVDFIISGTNIYFLISGIGSDAKIIKYTLTGIWQETINLPLVENARSLTIDTSNNFWVVTYTNPVQLVRVWNDGTWNVTITDIGSGI